MAITIDEMNQKVAKIAELRAKESEISMQKKVISDELAAAEGEMLEILVAENMTQYRGPAGMASISVRTSVKTPKTLEDKAAFFQYLKDKGLYDTMVSVNSVTLNAFYKKELEVAREQGNLAFEVPGINEVKHEAILSFRK